MNIYLRGLSGTQNVWFASAVAGAFVIMAAGFLLEPPLPVSQVAHFTIDSSIRQIAPKLGVTGKSLARELGLPLDVPKKVPISRLEVSPEILEHATEHLLSHHAASAKYYLFAAIVLFALVFLLRLGRPDLSPPAERRHWYPQPIYLTVLAIAVLAGGFALGKSPNPMEGAVKAFKAMVGLYPSVAGKAAAFGFFLFLAIVGNKLICGWACPFGALQELLYRLPMLRRVKKRKPPFWIMNTIRGSLLAVMLLLMFGILGSSEGFVLYHGINPFNLFDLHFESWTILATVVASLVLSLALYRPFCLLVCPFGFLSWIIERVSLTRVRVDRAKCTDCGACGLTCPTGAAEGLIEGKSFHADCFSCARCLSICPEEALSYGSPLFKRWDKVVVNTRQAYRLSSQVQSTHKHLR